MNTNYGLTYPKETDFYDINIFNSNFSALADGIDSVKNTTVKGNHEIVIASENSSERVKKLLTLYVRQRTRLLFFKMQ